uniref:Uncharacterized protein n=1 Tax=Euplotes crassus TaxID=5936 RepID=A0A7S3KPV8_EUPCR|mmetsp:Transcript_39018/g.38639  ORF Transcript_39018/g.38639 Transcript_39018/m.38639 type:complete len:110 (+) Transcript_39018:110-439(+)
MTKGSLKLGEDSSDEEEKPQIIDINDGSKKKIVVDKSLDSELSFTLLVQKIRRKFMINAITSNKDEKKIRGNKILKNVEKQLALQRQNKLDNFDLDGDLVDSYNLDINP